MLQYVAVSLVAGVFAFGSLAFSAGEAGAFPVSIENCGVTETLATTPERLLLVTNGSLPVLIELDALDLVAGRTHDAPEDVFGSVVADAVSRVPFLAAAENATGGSTISLEAILAAAPDLVLAPENAIDRRLLAGAKVPFYSPPAYCEDPAFIPAGTANFDLVFEELAAFGEMLGRRDLAAERVAALKSMLAEAASQNVADAPSAIAIYVSAGGRTLYAYGARSMVTPVFEAAGLRNVYADKDERVFEASLEEILQRNPDVIVLLHEVGAGDTIMGEFEGVPGVDSLSAVRSGNVFSLLRDYTDPPTPLSVRGVAALSEKLAAAR